jgi:ATP adenylyltransferase
MDYLFNLEKIKYIKGDKPDIECILCGIRDNDNKVKNLEIYRNQDFIISLNLYPFNPGHIMIFPLKHIEDYTEFSDIEAAEIHKLTRISIEILRNHFNCQGLNIGYNLGTNSGASIKHIHQHIVPRYGNELGFMDVVSGTRVFVVDPIEVRDRLKELFFSAFN